MINACPSLLLFVSHVSTVPLAREFRPPPNELMHKKQSSDLFKKGSVDHQFLFIYDYPREWFGLFGRTASKANNQNTNQQLILVGILSSDAIDTNNETRQPPD